eukprot:CAMPEP_0119292950 /NCGR_PEP_ID=MMETSP1329-20130426/45117_1 /TAXON_ID=114041 /ORGANISM="Genus nov. species nov., Strain RCC1024" /LENGTH=198 /DNA_ID=CAMNT_0007293803 /DNA_START=222 /DNA_END=815 /DNA_ORIENTATION=-
MRPSSLRVAVLLGSTRDGPPRPANLSRRIGAFVSEILARRGHEVDVVDPVVEDLPLLVKPHFAYHPSQVPDTLDQLNSRLLGADAYVAVTPEYNHAPSPALLNMINHIGSSVMSYKPSLIVSYSQGQWGGARAAIGLRAPLSEMGCIPVSAMIHIPKAHEVLDAKGVPSADPDQWTGYVDRGVAQLEWWGTAAKEHKT